MGQKTVDDIRQAKTQAEATIQAVINEQLQKVRDETGLTPDSVNVNLQRDGKGIITVHAVVIRLVV